MDLGCVECERACNPMHVSNLAWHLQLLAANVVNPIHIDVTKEEVNGLDHIVEELVRALDWG